MSNQELFDQYFQQACDSNAASSHYDLHTDDHIDELEVHEDSTLPNVMFSHNDSHDDFELLI